MPTAVTRPQTVGYLDKLKRIDCAPYIQQKLLLLEYTIHLCASRPIPNAVGMLHCTVRRYEPMGILPKYELYLAATMAHDRLGAGEAAAHCEKGAACDGQVQFHCGPCQAQR